MTEAEPWLDQALPRSETAVWVVLEAVPDGPVASVVPVPGASPDGAVVLPVGPGAISVVVPGGDAAVSVVPAPEPVSVAPEPVSTGADVGSVVPVAVVEVGAVGGVPAPVGPGVAAVPDGVVGVVPGAFVAPVAGVAAVPVGQGVPVWA